MDNNSFLYALDNEKIVNLLNDTYNNSTQLMHITDSVISTYTKDLDEIMAQITAETTQDDTDISTIRLEKLLIKLCDKLYFLSTQLEKVGVQDDVSKAARQEIYNKAYLNNDVEYTNSAGRKVKPTKDSNSAVAEEQSKYETIINNLFNRTYKVIKLKTEAAYEQVSSIKKILSRRIQEMQPYQPNTNINE